MLHAIVLVTLCFASLPRLYVKIDVFLRYTIIHKADYLVRTWSFFDFTVCHEK